MPRLPALLTMTLVCLVTASCGGNATGRPAAASYASNATFTIGTPAALSSFDPYRDRAVLTFGKLAYDSLANLQPDGKYVSGLASRWQVSAQSATFTMRPDITCSDGTLLKPSNVATAINYVADPKNQSWLYGVQTPTVPLTAMGDDTAGTVKVTVQQPFGLLLETVGVLPIVCPRGMQNPGLLKSSSDGTGPYVLSAFAPGQSATFKVRSDYKWGPNGATTNVAGIPSKVVIKTVTNETTAANLLVSGELNLTKIAGQEMQRLDSQGFDKADLQSGLALWFNEKGRPPADERVRRALVQALDLGQVAKVASDGRGGPATGLVALKPKVCNNDTVSGHLPGYDSQASENLLAQAGWQKGADGVYVKDGKPLELDLHYVTDYNPLDKPTAELMSQKWQALGIKVHLTSETSTAYAKTVYETGDWDVYIAQYGFYLPSQWIPYVSGATPPKGLNKGWIDNQAYNKLAAQALTLRPPAACKYWDQAEQSLFDKVDIAPISFRPDFYYLNNAKADITGFEFPVPTSMRVLK